MTSLWYTPSHLIKPSLNPLKSQLNHMKSQFNHIPSQLNHMKFASNSMNSLWTPNEIPIFSTLFWVSFPPFPCRAWPTRWWPPGSAAPRAACAARRSAPGPPREGAGSPRAAPGEVGRVHREARDDDDDDDDDDEWDDLYSSIVV